MRPIVSVIVPVYNVEDVLARCLDSLCRQSLQEIEIILVDDASPDRCGEICEEYAEKDSRFRVIHYPEHRGVAAARNTGIAHASADYLMFVDSDDWVHMDFCKLPYECAKQHGADLVMFGFQLINKHSLCKLNLKKNFDESGSKTQLEALNLYFTKSKAWLWNKMFKKSLFHTILFPEGYLYEDIGTTYKTFLLADTIWCLDKELYYHCYYHGSITTLKTGKAFKDWYAMSMQQYHDLKECGYPKDKLERRLQDIALTYCIRRKADWKNAEFVFYFNILQAAHHVPEHFTWKRKILFMLLKYCPPVFDLVCNLWGRRWHCNE